MLVLSLTGFEPEAAVAPLNSVRDRLS